MADFTFYGSWRDTRGILNHIIRTGEYEVIADIAYKKPEFLQIRSLSEYEVKKLKKNHSVYLWSESYSKYPISFDSPDPKGYMGIEMQESGPLIHMGLADIYKEDRFFRVASGYIHYPPYFISPKTKRSYPPPPGIYKAFRSIKKIIQKSLIKQYWQYENPFSNGDTRLTTEPLWIGKDAFDLMQSEIYFIEKGWMKVTKNWLKPSRE